MLRDESLISSFLACGGFVYCHIEQLPKVTKTGVCGSPSCLVASLSVAVVWFFPHIRL